MSSERGNNRSIRSEKKARMKERKNNKQRQKNRLN